MKISTEIKNLKKRIKERAGDEVISYLMIAIECNKKSWTVTPVFECSGDGHPTYFFADGDKYHGPIIVFQAKGNTLVKAVNKLKKQLDKMEKKDLYLYRW